MDATAVNQRVLDKLAVANLSDCSDGYFRVWFVVLRIVKMNESSGRS
jgi:hypothetical protein